MFRKQPDVDLTCLDAEYTGKDIAFRAEVLSIHTTSTEGEAVEGTRLAHRTSWIKSFKRKRGSGGTLQGVFTAKYLG